MDDGRECRGGSDYVGSFPEMMSELSELVGNLPSRVIDLSLLALPLSPWSSCVYLSAAA